MPMDSGTRTAPRPNESVNAARTGLLHPEDEPELLHSPLDIAALSNRKPALVALFATIAYLAMGVVGFHTILHLTWASAFYFAVTTSLTVGYGDIDAWTSMTRNDTSANDGDAYTPSDGALIFTMLYIIGGMIVMGTSLGLLLQQALEGTGRRTDSVASRHPLIVSALVCLLIILAGAGIIGVLEGHNAVHGLYWAIVTVSTVGYGSGHPTSDGARVLVGCYMLVGVACVGNVVSELADRPLQAHRRRLEEKVINQYGASLEEEELWELAGSEQFQALDLRPLPGVAPGVTRDAFCLLMLVRTEKLSAEDLQRCQAAFDLLDADQSGTLNNDDVAVGKAAAIERARLAEASRDSLHGAVA